MIFQIKIWYFKSKYQKIGALINSNYKYLKIILILKIKKLDLDLLAPKLGEFLLFNNFFSNLAKFQNLNNFLFFDFSYLDNFWNLSNFFFFQISSFLSIFHTIIINIKLMNFIIIIIWFRDLLNTIIFTEDWLIR